LGGCSTLGYYWQSASGHLSLMKAARPVDDWLQDPAAPEALKTRLALASEIRRFAATELQLPDNASYQRYAALQRSAVVWNVVAAPELSLKLKRWCFVLAGCVSYKGFFDLADAEAEAAPLRAQGLDVSVQPVPAYSTLGWMNWAGGDPLLSTFIGWPEGELARLIFHELAHQVLYVAGDTPFNESFATTVERLGGARWLSQRASPQTRADYDRFHARRQQFRALTLALQAELLDIYGETKPPRYGEAEADAEEVAEADAASAFRQRMQADPPTDPHTKQRTKQHTKQRTDQLARKTAALDTFRQRYAALKLSWGGFAGYDAWVAGANNASLGALSGYDQWVPALEALFEQHGRDWRKFYKAAKALAALPRHAREAALRAASPITAPLLERERPLHGRDFD